MAMAVATMTGDSSTSASAEKKMSNPRFITESQSAIGRSKTSRNGTAPS